MQKRSPRGMRGLFLLQKSIYDKTYLFDMDKKQYFFGYLLCEFDKKE